MNNRNLLIIFGLCLVAFFASRLLRKEHKSSFDPVISAIDSNAVDRIHFATMQPQPDQFELVKEENNWFASKDQQKVNASSGRISMILEQLASLKANRVLTREPSQYEQFEITDEKATNLVAYHGNKELVNLYIGGFNFDQATQSASGFVRKKNDPTVYEVNGFQVLGLKQRFDQYRDKALVKVAKEDLTKIEWVNANGRKEALQVEDGVWHYAGMEALDSAAVNQYLELLVNAQGTDFSELTSLNGLNMAEKLTLFGNNMIAPTSITLYQSNDALRPFLIHSTANPEAIFTSDSTGLYQRVFYDLRQFWPNGQ